MTTNIEYLKNFGLAYNKREEFDRAIVTFADDLIKLPPKMQSHFYSYYLDNQDDYYPNEGFVKNLILGEWVDTISIYQALTMELHYINKMCEAFDTASEGYLILSIISVSLSGLNVNFVHLD